MTAPGIRPATDEEIAGYCGEIAIYQRGVDRYLHCVQCDASPGSMGGHRPGCDFTVWPRIKARIEADRAAAQERDRQIAALEQERDDDTALIRRLNATVAAQAKEIGRLRIALVTLEERLFDLVEQAPICQLHRAGLSAMVDFIRATLKPESPVR